MTLLTIIGGSEHARVVIETARTRPHQWQIEGFADPQPCEDTQQRLGVAWLGDDAKALARPDADRRYVLAVGAIGASDLRVRIFERYRGVKFATLIHAHAWISPTATIDEGAVVFAGAVIQSGAHIGAHAVVGSGTIVEHDVQLAAFVQTGPRVAIGGGARIGEGTYLGLGACVRDHIAVGARALVGMGAAVTADVADGTTVVGVPARPVVL